MYWCINNASLQCHTVAVEYRSCRDPLIYYTNALLVFVRWSLQFENNSDSHVIAAPTDAFWKSGAGGFCLYIIPSLDMVIYKLGGATVQVVCARTGTAIARL